MKDKKCINNSCKTIKIWLVFLHRKFRDEFKTDVDPDMDWEFEPVQDSVIVNAGETALVFHRAYNREEKPVIGKLFQVF